MNLSLINNSRMVGRTIISSGRTMTISQSMTWLGWYRRLYKRELNAYDITIKEQPSPVALISHPMSTSPGS